MYPTDALHIFCIPALALDEADELDLDEAELDLDDAELDLDALDDEDEDADDEELDLEEVEISLAFLNVIEALLLESVSSPSLSAILN